MHRVGLKFGIQVLGTLGIGWYQKRMDDRLLLSKNCGKVQEILQ
jgi:hypothetical protein